MNILITGGTGLVGNELTNMLLEKGHMVRHLSRRKRKHGRVKNFHWDVDKNIIQEGALEDVHAIVHLAGENVAAGRWTNKQKNKIMQSRVASAKLLHQAVEASSTKPTIFVSASGVGIYGIDTGDKLMEEIHSKGEGFLAYVVEKWEEAADFFNSLNMRVVKLRVGVVLASEGGALTKMAQPVKYMLGAPLGHGNQYMSWVHINDLCRSIMWSIDHKEMDGVYNLVSPNPVTNKELTHLIAKALNRRILLPNMPAFILKLMLGEMSSIVLGGNKVSNERISKTGFQFNYQNAEQAIDQILKKN